jgi:hypothetical protein
MRNNVLLASALVLLGCSDRNFNKPELLVEPRILAVQAEPPQPSHGASATLRALVYFPDSGAGATYKWSWCPLPVDSKDRCPIGQAEFDQIYNTLGLGTAPSLDLGNGETASFTNPFSAQLLLALCNGDVSITLGTSSATASGIDGGSKSIFTCDRAADNNDPIYFPITVALVVTPSGLAELPAIFTLHLLIDETLPGNANPTIDGIRVSDADEWLDEAASVAIARQQRTNLDVRLLQSSSEPLARPRTSDKANRALLTREKLNVWWFTEAGDFGHDGLGGYTTGYLPNSDPTVDAQSFSDAKSNVWTLPKRDDYARTTSRIVVVVNDGRDGVAWTSAAATLKD